MAISILDVQGDHRNKGWIYGDNRFMILANAHIIKGVMACTDNNFSITGGEILYAGNNQWIWYIIWPEDYFRWSYDNGEYICNDSHYRVTIYGDGGEGDVAQYSFTAMAGSSRTAPPRNLRVNGYEVWNYDTYSKCMVDSKAELSWLYPVGGTSTPFTVHVSSIYPYGGGSSHIGTFHRFYTTDENTFRVPITDLRESALDENNHLSFYVTAASGGQSMKWEGFKFNGQGGTVAYWDGTQWVTCYANYYDGAQWKQAMPRYWDGTEWVECSR